MSSLDNVYLVDTGTGSVGMSFKSHSAMVKWADKQPAPIAIATHRGKMVYRRESDGMAPIKILDFVQCRTSGAEPKPPRGVRSKGAHEAFKSFRELGRAKGKKASKRRVNRSYEAMKRRENQRASEVVVIRAK